MTEHVTMDDPHIGVLLHFVLSQRMPGEPLIRLTPHAFRSLFCALLQALGLEAKSFMPYSLRRGGACHDYTMHGNVQRTILRGRWSALATARIYITEGYRQVTELSLPPQTPIVCARFQAVLQNCLMQICPILKLQLGCLLQRI